MNETSNWAERRAASVSHTPAQAALPLNRLERVAAWGGASAGTSFVYRPVNLTQLQEIFALARATGRTVGFRGGGNSYGDAAQNDEHILIDLTRFNRVLDWNPTTGRITVEPGLTLRDLFSYVIGDGWWPPVCTGTAKITIGGGAAMNVHGKNAFAKGTIGEHIYAFDLLLGTGEIVTCSRDENSDLFHAAIGGMGMLGCFTSLTLKMHRVYSGELTVTALPAANLAEMIRYFETEADQSDYLVGWVDAFSKGRRLGRGEIHKANYLPPGADPAPEQSLRLDNQHLPDTIMGSFPSRLSGSACVCSPTTCSGGWSILLATRWPILKAKSSTVRDMPRSTFCWTTCRTGKRRMVQAASFNTRPLFPESRRWRLLRRCFV